LREPPRILIVDDDALSRDVLVSRLVNQPYETMTASDGEEALVLARTHQPDLMLLDVMMPRMDGLQVCRLLKADPSFPFTPIILITARADSKDVVAGLEAGGDEYLVKPVDPAALVARIASMLRIKALHDTVQQQAARLESQGAQLAQLNRTLEARVREQVDELERLGRLRRFLAPQVAELIVSAEGEALLDVHRREVAVLCCGLQGFTSFAETTEPETVVGVLREYHEALGTLIFRFEGTVERMAGDMLTVIFNDPLPCDEPAARAVHLAVAGRERVQELSAAWRKRGHAVNFGAGIDLGYATLGTIGFEGRLDYGAVGTVVNLAARLCDEAQPGQILVSQRAYAATEELVEASSLGELSLQGFVKPVGAFSIHQVRTGVEPAPDAAPARPRPPAGQDLLTSREREVAELIASGFTNRQIAERLSVSERTADRHVENIRDKLSVSSRAQIAAWAVEHGLRAASPEAGAAASETAHASD
jgi:adenylate cyclase